MRPSICLRMPRKSRIEDPPHPPFIREAADQMVLTPSIITRLPYPGDFGNFGGVPVPPRGIVDIPAQMCFNNSRIIFWGTLARPARRSPLLGGAHAGSAERQSRPEG